MDYQCDEEGLYCPKCGLNPHFCRCEQIYSELDEPVEAIVKTMLRLQENSYAPLGKEWHLDETDQELISLN